jgi:hypothetical protein
MAGVFCARDADEIVTQMNRPTSAALKTAALLAGFINKEIPP